MSMVESKHEKRRLLGCLLTGLLGAGGVAFAGDEKIEPALGGHCPVSYQTDGQAVKGDPGIHAEYQGFVYFFADENKKKLFQENPDKYVPQCGGLCLVALGGPYGNRFAGDPTVFAVIDGKLYLLSSERAKMSFDQKPQHYISRALELFDVPEIGGYSPVSYQLHGLAKEGSKQNSAVFRGKVYHFADSAEKEAFLQDPQRFLPRFDGFCAEAVSRGKKYAANPRVFLLRDGKTYLFFDADARAAFQVNPEQSIQAANDHWPRVKTLKSP